MHEKMVLKLLWGVHLHCQNMQSRVYICLCTCLLNGVMDEPTASAGYICLVVVDCIVQFMFVFVVDAVLFNRSPLTCIFVLTILLS